MNTLGISYRFFCLLSFVIRKINTRTFKSIKYCGSKRSIMKLIIGISFILTLARGHVNQPEEPASFVPEGYVLRWEDSFDGPNINTSNWIIGSLRDPLTGMNDQSS